MGHKGGYTERLNESIALVRECTDAGIAMCERVY